jgi:hypothetical protein
VSRLKPKCQSRWLTGDNGVDDGEPAHPLGVIGSEGVSGPHADVVADHVEPVVPERGHQRDQIGGQRAGVVTVVGLVGEPGPARVDGDDGVLAGEREHHFPPGVPGLWPPADQQQRWAVPAGDRVQPQPVQLHEPAGEDAGEPVGQPQRTQASRSRRPYPQDPLP